MPEMRTKALCTWLDNGKQHQGKVGKEWDECCRYREVPTPTTASPPSDGRPACSGGG